MSKKRKDIIFLDSSDIVISDDVCEFKKGGDLTDHRNQDCVDGDDCEDDEDDTNVANTSTAVPTPTNQVQEECGWHITCLGSDAIWITDDHSTSIPIAPMQHHTHVDHDPYDTTNQSNGSLMDLEISRLNNYSELLGKQLKNIPPEWKLNSCDIKRLTNNIDTSIFNDNNCCLWNGYITNKNNISKGTYINFYFNGKKTALHRLLYSNYVQPLDENEYIKFTCPNKGSCCNVNHLTKYIYSKSSIRSTKGKKNDVKKLVIDEDACNVFEL